MILNFYLRKHLPKGEMRTVERHNLAKVRILLKKQGVKNVFKLDYHEAIQTLAKLIAEEWSSLDSSFNAKHAQVMSRQASFYEVGKLTIKSVR